MSSKKPLIALTPALNYETGDSYSRPNYLSAILAAGGIPVILPIDLTEADMPQVVEAFDGFLFTGGPDVYPFFFQEETHPHCGNVSLKRDQLELSLLQHILNAKKPILGICRGIQLLNIGLGGTIYQDISSQFPQENPVAHKQPFAYDLPSHTVEVVSGSRLAELSHGARLRVNSMHHQAIRQLAPSLTATGFAPNGLIECVEMADYPYFLAVQWHPEYLWQTDPAAYGIFSGFVDASR